MNKIVHITGVTDQDDDRCGEVLGSYAEARKPDGTSRKPLNIDRLRTLGWQEKTLLRDGISLAFADFLTEVIA